jgi:hypothetical protein
VSASRAQLEVASALVARASCRSAALARLEQASWSSPRERFSALVEAARFAVCAWRAERQAAARLAPSRALRTSPGALPVPEWLEPDVVEVAGPGVMRALFAGARASGSSAARDGYAHAYAAEIARASSQPREALAQARSALVRLPEAERLLRARCSVIAADAALDVGDLPAAAAYFARALALDGGALRRAGVALPVRFAPDADPVARVAARVLRSSPRLRAADGVLRLVLSADAARARACLQDAQDARLLCAEVEARPAEPTLATARRLSAAFHARAFAPPAESSADALDPLDDTLLR